MQGGSDIGAAVVSGGAEIARSKSVTGEDVLAKQNYKEDTHLERLPEEPLRLRRC